MSCAGRGGCVACLVNILLVGGRLARRDSMFRLSIASLRDFFAGTGGRGSSTGAAVTGEMDEFDFSSCGAVDPPVI